MANISMSAHYARRSRRYTTLHLLVHPCVLTLAKLERDRETLLKKVQVAQSDVQAKAGEIAIIRRNQDKANKEHERQVSVLQKLHAETLTKREAELEAAKKDREKMETNNRFLEHDLVQEAKRAKQAARAARDGGNARMRAAGQGSPATTPKKARALPFGDGFDGDDIVMVSPSKARERRKGSTPRAGEKRKRAGTEQGFASPSQLLSFSEAVPLPVEEPTEAQGIDNVVDVAAHLSKEDERFEVSQSISRFSLSIVIPLGVTVSSYEHLRFLQNHEGSPLRRLLCPVPWPAS